MRVLERAHPSVVLYDQRRSDLLVQEVLTLYLLYLGLDYGNGLDRINGNLTNVLEVVLNAPSCVTYLPRSAPFVTFLNNSGSIVFRCGLTCQQEMLATRLYCDRGLLGLRVRICYQPSSRI